MNNNTSGDQSSKASSRKKQKRSNVFQDSLFSPSTPITASVTSSICTSPLSFDIPPPSPKDSTSGYLSPTFLRDDSSNFPSNNSFDRSSLFYPAQVPNQSHMNYSHAGSRKANVGRPTSNYRNYAGAVSHNWNPRAGGYGAQMNRNPPSARWPESSSGYSSSNEGLQNFDANLSQLEPFPLDMEDPLFDLESTWADPTPVVSPAQYPTQSARRNSSGKNKDNLQSFNSKLDAIHENLKETMMRSSRSDQGRMLSMLSSWARKVAQSPFGVVQTTNNAVRRGKVLVSPSAKSETQRTPNMPCHNQASV
eukprot:scaffold219843_cov53-Attheya_sp.AAC.2